MTNGIEGLGGKTAPVVEQAAVDETPRATAQETPATPTTQGDGVDSTPQPASQQPPGDSREGFLSALNPSRLFGGNRSAATGSQQPDPPQEEGSFLSGMMDGLRTAGEKLGQFTELMNNPFVKHGLEVLRESGLNGMQLGAQVKADIENGTIPAAMVGRLQNGRMRTGDVAFLLGYLRDLAGGSLTIQLDNEAARALLQEVPLPPEVKAETIREVQLGPGDRLVVRLTGDPVYDAGAVSADFGRELSFTISGIGDANATRLTFEGDRGTTAEMLFSGWNLELTDNKTVDGILSFLVKLLLSPFLLIASLWGEVAGTRVELEDDEGRARLQVETMGATVIDQALDAQALDEEKQQHLDELARERAAEREREGDG